MGSTALDAIVLYSESGNHAQVVTASEKARHCSVRPGMPLAEAQALIDSGKLNDNEVGKLIKKRQYDLVIRAMAIKAEVQPQIARKIVESKSGKTIVALVWASGLSMRTAMDVQKVVAKVPPSEHINARGGTEYPLTEDEMSWYLDFFAE